MNNFEKFFLKPKSRGFKKNIETWKKECLDAKEFKAEETDKNIYLFYHINKGVCQHPDCNKASRFISLGRGFKETCSRVHAMELTSLTKYGVKYKSQLPEFRESVKKTNLERYGSENAMQNTEVKNKIKKTNLERYGYENAMQNDAVKNMCIESNISNNGGIGFQLETAKNTMIAKYGVENASQVVKFQEQKKETFKRNYDYDHPMKSKIVMNKVKATNLEKYGVENVFSSEIIKEKSKVTNLEKYGFEFYSQTNESRLQSSIRMQLLGDNHWMKDVNCILKRKMTWRAKYGVDHPMQTGEVFEKNLNSTYRRKEFIWKTGESSFVQGNEPIVLRELEESGYSFCEVKTKQIDMPEIWYFFEGKKSRYYPDFFIPNENRIIEVKSEFTLCNDLLRNNAKFERVKDMGFGFDLEVR